MSFSLPDKIHTITLPLLYPLMPVNVYLIAGEKPTLIDTGFDTDVAWRGLIAGLSRYDLAPKDIAQVIITHGHIDHHGLCGRLLDAGDLEVYVHGNDAYRVTSSIDELIGKVEGNAKKFIEMGISPRDVDRIFRNYINITRRYYRKLDRLTLVNEGDIIDCGNMKLEVIHTPGHSEGSICLLLQGERVIFTGDHIMEGLATNPLPEMGDEQSVGLMSYLDSLIKIKKFLPEAILPGHGKEFKNDARPIDSLLDYHGLLSQKIQKKIYDAWHSPKSLGEILYPNISGMHAPHAIFEIHSHLTSLESGGMVKSENRDGIIHFRGVKRGA